MPDDGVGVCAITVVAAPLIRSARRLAAAETIQCFRIFMGTSYSLVVPRRSGDLGVAAGGILKPR